MRRFQAGLNVALVICLLATLAVYSITASAAGSNWAQWRGPESQGISQEKNLPTEWDATKNVQWKTPLAGRGHSSPIVWENRIFLTTAVEGGPAPADHKAYKHMLGDKEFKHPDWAGSDKIHTMKVVSFDAQSGKLLWEKTAYEGPVFDHRHKRNTYASPTPVTDGRYVIASFGSEGVYCYDFSGKQLWKVSLGGIPTLGMGAGTSPVLFNNLVILQCDQNTGENSFIVALDKKTGKEVWRTARKVQASWSTPVIVKTQSRTEMITNGNEWTISYDPATGKELWRCKGVESNAIHTPMVGHGLVIVSAGYPAKRTIAIKLGGSGDLTGTPSVVWKYEKGTAYVASPILYGDYVYIISDKGVITCLDAKTGEVKYEGGRVPVPASFMGSPVAFDGKILITSDDGDTFVVKAGAAHEILRTNSLAEPIFTTPALANGKIYIRGDKNLYCISSGAGKQG
jgi:outer membrane protein assembly factor BamB